MTVSFQSRCGRCDLGHSVTLLTHPRGHKYVVHGHRATDDRERCLNYDDECRSLGEPLGWYGFAWRPRRCRNGKLRWLVSTERHSDGTYSLGNRAH